jgi:hypothetical protein
MRHGDDNNNEPVKPLWYQDGSIQDEIFYDRYSTWDRSNLRDDNGGGHGGHHFTIVSHSDPLMISFFADDEKGMLNKRTKMSPGKYLKKYYSHKYNDRQIEEYANKHKEYFSPAKIHWANTPEEIEAVYTMPHSGFTSCMQYATHRFNSKPYHPARIYGAGDLSVAYITNKDGYLIARALVWKEKNLVGRVYGDSFVFRAALAGAGINTKSDVSNYDYLGGAKLLKLTINYDGNDTIVAPYIDGRYRYLADMGDHLTIDVDGKYHAEWTDGLARERPFCQYSNTYTSRSLMTVWVWQESTKEYIRQNWSEEYHSETVTDRLEGARYSRANNKLVSFKSGRSGELMDRFRAEDPKRYSRYFFTSDYSGETFYDVDYMVRIGGKTYALFEAEKIAFKSDYDNIWYLNEVGKELVSNQTWTTEQAKAHAKQRKVNDKFVFMLDRNAFIYDMNKKLKSKKERVVDIDEATTIVSRFNMEYDHKIDMYRSDIEGSKWYLNASEVAVYGGYRTNVPSSMLVEDTPVPVVEDITSDTTSTYYDDIIEADVEPTYTYR